MNRGTHPWSKGSAVTGYPNQEIIAVYVVREKSPDRNVSSSPGPDMGEGHLMVFFLSFSYVVHHVERVRGAQGSSLWELPRSEVRAQHTTSLVRLRGRS